MSASVHSLFCRFLLNKLDQGTRLTSHSIPIPTHEPSISTLPFPIEKCHFDLLSLIFQYVVTEEDVDIDSLSGSLRIPTPHEPVRLMLVCRQWCQLVSSTPSLWRFFGLSLNSPKGRVISRLKRFSSLVKGGQVDLYLCDMHVYRSCDGLSHSPNDCASRKETITMIVDSLPRLQKLFVSFVSNPADFDDLAECWSQAASIHELIYSMNNGWLWLLKDFLLAPHVQHLPYLSSLSLDNAGNVSVPPPGAHPLLPNLTTLTLGSAGPSLALYRLTTLLSHCPLLQRVACKSGKYVEEHHQNLQFFQLRHLSSIETDQELPLKIFSSYIETPVLRKLTLYKYSGDWITEFVQKNRGIEDLILNVRTSPSYDIILTYLTQLRVLSVGGHGHGHFLRPLYTPLPRNSGAPPCAETLQRLEIVISRDKLHMEYFEKLVHARFIPVNKEGYTAAGCKAMHELILIAVEYNQVSKQVQESVLWKRAKITKPRSEVFVLHWDFEDTAETS